MIFLTELNGIKTCKLKKTGFYCPWTVSLTYARFKVCVSFTKVRFKVCMSFIYAPFGANNTIQVLWTAHKWKTYILRADPNIRSAYFELNLIERHAYFKPCKNKTVWEPKFISKTSSDKNKSFLSTKTWIMTPFCPINGAF